jgi:hypothetical protein
MEVKKQQATLLQTLSLPVSKVTILSRFGFSLDMDCDLLVVGAPYNSGSNYGALVQLFRRGSDDQYKLLTTLRPPVVVPTQSTYSKD